MDATNRRLAAARELVTEAGRRARELRDGGLTRDEKGRHDFVTAADREIEETIRRELHALFPEDRFLGEETGLRDSEDEASGGTAEKRPSDGATRDAGLWILDPVDGTANFAAGLDVWCVSLAWIRDGEAHLGVVYAPDCDELYVARRGGGTSLNGRPLSITDTTPVEHSLIMTGRGASLTVEQHLEILRRILALGFEYRRFGSGALGIARVATGRIQGYVEPAMYPWDVAAARLVVEEAGGALSPYPFDAPGQKLGPPVVACRR
ncbi:MAG: inositol monophosphatase, partial [Spirochaetales bacterium]|nr:inositol monophosphatase [Spirochaetales bacterium]